MKRSLEPKEAVRRTHEYLHVWGWSAVDPTVAHGRYWSRRFVRDWLPALQLDNESLQQFLASHDW